MLTLELKNYVSQSLSKGMPEVQIRQNLYSQGWTPEDLDEAFKAMGHITPTPAPTHTGIPTTITPIEPSVATPVATTFFGGKIIAIIIAIMLMAGGAGGYYFYSQKSTPVAPVDQTTQNENTQNTNVTQDNLTPNQPKSGALEPWEDAVKGHFSCGDLFKATDYVKIIEKPESDYKLKESKDYYVLRCSSYDGLFSFEIWWGNTSLPDIVMTTWKSQKESALKDVFKLGVKNIPDIGSEAFSEGTYYEDGTHWDTVDALSTDKEYIIHVSAGNTLKNKILAPTLEFDQLKEIAKVISDNLDNY